MSARSDATPTSDLSDEVEAALAWATACETGPDVGSRALLYGIVRVASPDDVVWDVLRAMRIRFEQLLQALQLAAGPSLDLTTHPDRDEGSASSNALTSNALSCLRAAADLPPADSPADLARLLGGVLLTAKGSGALALYNLAGGATFDVVGSAYLRWLRNGRQGTAREVLGRVAPADEMFSRSLSRPTTLSPIWQDIVVAQTPPPGDDSSGGPVTSSLGLFLADDFAMLPETADLAALYLPAEDRPIQFEVIASRDGVSFARVQTYLAAVGPRPRARAVNGEPCMIAVAGDLAPTISFVAGAVTAADPSTESFEVVMDSSILVDRIHIGSPVFNASYELIGMLVPGNVSQQVPQGILAAIAIPNVASADEVMTSTAATGPSIGELSGAGNDRVGDVDRLGFEAYVRAFAELVVSPYTEPPLTIGIFGSWGRGKSFLLDHIARQIQLRQGADEPGPTVSVVRFNAWMYSTMDAVWPALVRTIITELDRLETWPRRRRVIERMRWNLRRQWRQLSRTIIATVLAVAISIGVAVVQKQAGIAALIGGGALLAGLLGAVKAGRDSVAQWVTGVFAGTDYGHQVELMEDIEHDLTTLEKRLHEGGRSRAPVTGRIFIVIDDLDRCEPGKAVEVLQAVNLLLNFPSFIVCLGIDARLVTAAIEAHYQGLLGASGASGYEYLDKIVQIPFLIPEPGPDEIDAFLTALFGDPPRNASDAQAAGGQPTADGGSGAPEVDSSLTVSPTLDELPPATTPVGARGTTAASADTPELAIASTSSAPPPAVAFTYPELEAFQAFTHCLRPNPRHLKRLVNVYRLVRTLMRSAGEALVVDRPAAVIRWLIMWSQWPYASAAMLRRFDEALAGHALAPYEGDPLAALLSAVEPRLDAADRALLDDDPADLRILLGIRAGALSWDEIARVRRFTVNFNPAVEERLRATTWDPPAAPPGSTEAANAL